MTIEFEVGRTHGQRTDSLSALGSGLLVLSCDVNETELRYSRQTEARGRTPPRGSDPTRRSRTEWPEVARWMAGTGLLGERKARLAGGPRRPGLGTTCRQGIRRGGKAPPLRRGAQSQGDKRELVWAQTGRAAGPPPGACAGTGAARGDRPGLSQPPVGWKLGRAGSTGNEFRK